MCQFVEIVQHFVENPQKNYFHSLIVKYSTNPSTIWQKSSASNAGAKFRVWNEIQLLGEIMNWGFISNYFFSQMITENFLSIQDTLSSKFSRCVRNLKYKNESWISWLNGRWWHVWYKRVRHMYIKSDIARSVRLVTLIIA